MKEVIVFGGSGFIGSHVADALTKEGYKVTIFDIKKSPYLSKGQNFIHGDVLNKKDVDRAISKNTYVYNFAGEADIDTSVSRPLETITTNVLGNANIIEGCRKHKIKRFIFASTVYVYSNAGAFYRSSKQASELFIEDYHKHYGVDFTILRYGTLYGPRADERNWLYGALKQVMENKKITRRGDGQEIREYIHVYDAARLSVKILEERFKNQYVMITGNQPIRIKDLMIMIKEILNNKIKLEFVKSDKEQHYQVTPYSFSPKLANKIVSDHYIDLGQGILDILDQMHKEQLIK